MNVPRTIKPVFETPYERAGVLTPGLPILPHGTERHPVPGGGSRAVPIFSGDEISVLDRDGLQPGELVFFTPDGKSDAGMLGASSVGRPEGVISVLANGSISGSRVPRHWTRPVSTWVGVRQSVFSRTDRTRVIWPRFTRDVMAF